mgnify:CR=1 FL=1
MRKTTILLTIILTFLLTMPAFAGEWGVVSSKVINFQSTSLPNGNNANAVYAAKFLDGIVLQPGEIFSFSNTLGPRTLERGFVVGENAAGYPDVGSGICREATVVFQAAKEAGMEILERWTHNPHVDYAAPGDDAAIQYGVCDLRFRNPYSVPVAISTRGDIDQNGLHLWAMFLKEENLPSVEIPTNKGLFEGKLFNGQTFVAAERFSQLYGKKIKLTEKLGLYSISVGEAVFSESNDALRSTDGFYVSLRKLSDTFGGIVLWVPGDSHKVALTLPETVIEGIAFWPWGVSRLGVLI